MSALGHFVKVGRRYSQHVFICDACDTVPVERHRKFRESPPERAARKALLDNGERFVQEYRLGKFYYDFAIPRLRMLLEIDPHSYHRLAVQQLKDTAKDKFAEKHGWLVARVRCRGFEPIKLSVQRALAERQSLLGV
jgi:very-short-patch-repair endonuclease